MYSAFEWSFLLALLMFMSVEFLVMGADCHLSLDHLLTNLYHSHDKQHMLQTIWIHEINTKSLDKRRKNHPMFLYYKMLKQPSSSMPKSTGMHTSAPTTWPQHKNQSQSPSTNNAYCILQELVFTISNRSLERTPSKHKTIPNTTNLQKKTQNTCTIYPQVLPRGKETQSNRSFQD